MTARLGVFPVLLVGTMFLFLMFNFLIQPLLFFITSILFIYYESHILCLNPLYRPELLIVIFSICYHILNVIPL